MNKQYVVVIAGAGLRERSAGRGRRSEGARGKGKEVNLRRCGTSGHARGPLEADKAGTVLSR